MNNQKWALSSFGGILTAALLRFIDDVFLWSSLGGEKNHKQLRMIVNNYDIVREVTGPSVKKFTTKV